MNDEKKRLIWKFFWQRKIREVSWVVIGLAISYFVGGFFYEDFISDTCIDEEDFFLFCYHFYITAMGFFTTLSITGIFFVIKMFIEANWEKAEEMAEEYLESRKKEVKTNE